MHLSSVTSRIVLSLTVLLFLLAPSTQAADAKTPPTKLTIGITKKVECSRPAKKGDTLRVHYTGTLFSDGTKFDSSLDRLEPFEFRLGVGHVIKGWDRGAMGMCPGEVRKLKVPADLAYGERGAPPAIPGNAALVFVVELLEIVQEDDTEYGDMGYETPIKDEL